MKLYRYSFIIIVLVALVFTSCDDSSKLNVDLSSTEKPKVNIRRYAKTMFAISQENFIDTLKYISQDFPLFFEGGLKDSLSLLNLKSFFSDPYMRELNDEVQLKFSNITILEDELANAMQYYKYYFPASQDFNYYSYVSGLDIKYPIKVAGNNIIIGLDLYLGTTKVYALSGFPKYKSIWLNPKAIVPDIMSEIALGILPEPDLSANLIHQFIEQGKRLYFIKAMMPNIGDSILLKYKKEQLEWCTNNESRLWSLMVENQFLFKTDIAIQKKFMDDGPFTKVLSSEAPARLGHFIGYRIVSSYMKNNDVSLVNLLLENDDQKILKKSRYKP